MNSPLDFGCGQCGHRQDAANAASCQKCGDSPLYDLRRPEIRDALLEDDQRRRLKRVDHARYVAVPITAAIGYALFATVGAYLPAIAILALILGSGVGIAALGSMVVPAKQFWGDFRGNGAEIAALAARYNAAQQASYVQQVGNALLRRLLYGGIAFVVFTVIGGILVLRAKASRAEAEAREAAVLSTWTPLRECLGRYDATPKPVPKPAQTADTRNADKDDRASALKAAAEFGMLDLLKTDETGGGGLGFGGLGVPKAQMSPDEEVRQAFGGKEAHGHEICAREGAVFVATLDDLPKYATLRSVLRDEAKCTKERCELALTPALANKVQKLTNELFYASSPRTR